MTLALALALALVLVLVLVLVLALALALALGSGSDSESISDSSQEDLIVSLWRESKVIIYSDPAMNEDKFVKGVGSKQQEKATDSSRRRNLYLKLLSDDHAEIPWDKRAGFQGAYESWSGEELRPLGSGEVLPGSFHWYPTKNMGGIDFVYPIHFQYRKPEGTGFIVTAFNSVWNSARVRISRDITSKIDLHGNCAFYQQERRLVASLAKSSQLVFNQSGKPEQDKSLTTYLTSKEMDLLIIFKDKDVGVDGADMYLHKASYIQLREDGCLERYDFVFYSEEVSDLKEQYIHVVDKSEVVTVYAALGRFSRQGASRSDFSVITLRPPDYDQSEKVSIPIAEISNSGYVDNVAMKAIQPRAGEIDQLLYYARKLNKTQPNKAMLNKDEGAGNVSAPGVFDFATGQISMEEQLLLTQPYVEAIPSRTDLSRLTPELCHLQNSMVQLSIAEESQRQSIRPVKKDNGASVNPSGAPALEGSENPVSIKTYQMEGFGKATDMITPGVSLPTTGRGGDMHSEQSTGMKYLSPIAEAACTGGRETSRCCEDFLAELNVDFHEAYRALATRFGVTDGLATHHDIYNLGLYTTGATVALLYAAGFTDQVIELFPHGKEILRVIKASGFQDVHSKMSLSEYGEDQRSGIKKVARGRELIFNLITLATLVRKDQSFLPGLKSRGSIGVIYELMGLLCDKEQVDDLRYHLAERFKNKIFEDEIRAATLLRPSAPDSRKLAFTPIIKPPAPVRVNRGMSRSESALWLTAAKVVNTGYSILEAIDRHYYDGFDDEDDLKATRGHLVPALSPHFYGIHLRTKEQFNAFVEELSSPFIVVVSGKSTNREMHAFLLCKNSRTGSFCSFQVRQGGYYPEYMDEAHILSYMDGEENSIYSALSLDKLHEIYQGSLNLKNLRVSLRDQMIDRWNYVPSSNNCLTFAFNAFGASDLDEKDMFKNAGLDKYHSPLRIMTAMESVVVNRPAFHQKNINELLPAFLSPYKK